MPVQDIIMKDMMEKDIRADLSENIFQRLPELSVLRMRMTL